MTPSSFLSMPSDSMAAPVATCDRAMSTNSRRFASARSRNTLLADSRIESDESLKVALSATPSSAPPVARRRQRQQRKAQSDDGGRKRMAFAGVFERAAPRQIGDPGARRRFRRDVRRREMGSQSVDRCADLRSQSIGFRFVFARCREIHAHARTLRTATRFARCFWRGRTATVSGQQRPNAAAASSRRSRPMRPRETPGRERARNARGTG